MHSYTGMNSSTGTYIKQLEKFQEKLIETKNAVIMLTTSLFDDLENSNSDSKANLETMLESLIRMKVTSDEMAQTVFNRHSEFIFPIQKVRLASTRFHLQSNELENEGRQVQEIPSSAIFNKKLMTASEPYRPSIALMYSSIAGPYCFNCVLWRNYMTLNIQTFSEFDGIIRVVDVFINEFDEKIPKLKNVETLWRAKEIYQSEFYSVKNNFEVHSAVFKAISKTLRNYFFSKFEIANFMGLFSLMNRFKDIFESDFKCNFCQKQMIFDELVGGIVPPTAYYLDNFFHENCLNRK